MPCRVYRQTLLEITDPEVLATSGKKYHPIVEQSPDSNDEVGGTPCSKSPRRNLPRPTNMKMSDYKRVAVTLKSGLEAWVYVRA